MRFRRKRLASDRVRRSLTRAVWQTHTEGVLQLSFKKRATHASARLSAPRHLADLREGQQGVLHHLDLPEDVSHRLMELGFLPGTVVTAAHCAPGGDPRVFRVDGSEIALRRETAAALHLAAGA